MSRRISFAKTISQFKARTKTETRRLGWDLLKVGDELVAVNKTMGFRKGEKAVVLGRIRVTATWREPLGAITQDGVNREGFPEMTPAEFVAFFCKINGCADGTNVRVIRYEFI